MTLREAAERYGESVVTLRSAVKRGLLKSEWQKREVRGALRRVHVVTDEAMREYLRRREERKSSIPILYAEERGAGAIPRHLRPQFYLWAKMLELGIDKTWDMATVINASRYVTVVDTETQEVALEAMR